VPVRPQLYRDDAVVLRVQKLGESDRIITMLTRRHGRVRAAAKGVRRTTSRFGARLEPFGHVDVQLAGHLGNPARSLHTIRQAEGIGLYGKQLGHDYPRYTAASAIAETAERLTPVELEPSLRLFQLTLGALRALAVAEHASTLVLDAFLLRAMATAGWAPALTACAVCGTAGRHAAFAVPSGGAVCPDCRPPGASRPAPATLDLMAALVGGDWRVADASAPAQRRECSGLVAAHLQRHLERGLRSLPLVDRATGAGEPTGPGPAGSGPAGSGPVGSGPAGFAPATGGTA
jgi:DNA repair protein RecO (recombination protein O)